MLLKEVAPDAPENILLQAIPEKIEVDETTLHGIGGGDQVIHKGVLDSPPASVQAGYASTD